MMLRSLYLSVLWLTRKQRGRRDTNTLVEVNAELLLNALSHSLADLVPEKLNDTMKAKALVDALTNTLAKMEAKTLGETVAQVKAD